MDKNLKVAIGIGLLIVGTIVFYLVTDMWWAGMTPVQRSGFRLVGWGIACILVYPAVAAWIGYQIGKRWRKASPAGTAELPSEPGATVQAADHGESA